MDFLKAIVIVIVASLVLTGVYLLFDLGGDKYVNKGDGTQYVATPNSHQQIYNGAQEQAADTGNTGSSSDDTTAGDAEESPQQQSDESAQNDQTDQSDQTQQSSGNADQPQSDSDDDAAAADSDADGEVTVHKSQSANDTQPEGESPAQTDSDSSAVERQLPPEFVELAEIMARHLDDGEITVDEVERSIAQLENRKRESAMNEGAYSGTADIIQELRIRFGKLEAQELTQEELETELEHWRSEAATEGDTQEKIRKRIMLLEVFRQYLSSTTDADDTAEQTADEGPSVPGPPDGEPEPVSYAQVQPREGGNLTHVNVFEETDDGNRVKLYENIRKDDLEGRSRPFRIVTEDSIETVIENPWRTSVKFDPSREPEIVTINGQDISRRRLFTRILPEELQLRPNMPRDNKVYVVWGERPNWRVTVHPLVDEEERQRIRSQRDASDEQNTGDDTHQDSQGRRSPPADALRGALDAQSRGADGAAAPQQHGRQPQTRGDQADGQGVVYVTRLNERGGPSLNVHEVPAGDQVVIRTQEYGAVRFPGWGQIYTRHGHEWWVSYPSVYGAEIDMPNRPVHTNPNAHLYIHKSSGENYFLDTDAMRWQGPFSGDVTFKRNF